MSLIGNNSYSLHFQLFSSKLRIVQLKKQRQDRENSKYELFYIIFNYVYKRDNIKYSKYFRLLHALPHAQNRFEFIHKNKALVIRADIMVLYYLGVNQTSLPKKTKIIILFSISVLGYISLSLGLSASWMRISGETDISKYLGNISITDRQKIIIGRMNILKSE